MNIAIAVHPDSRISRVRKIGVRAVNLFGPSLDPKPRDVAACAADKDPLASPIDRALAVTGPTCGVCAFERLDFDAPTDMPSVCEISSWLSPSITNKLKTARYAGESNLIASIISLYDSISIPVSP